MLNKLPLIVLLVALVWTIPRWQAISSTPASLSHMTSGEIIGQLPGSAQTLAVAGNYAYVGFETEFAVIDISDKSTPTEIGRLDIGERVRGIAVSNNHAYIASNIGLQIVDVSVPQNPRWAGIYEQVLVTQVQIRGEYTFILSRYGLDILSLVDAPVLTLVGRYETDMPTPLDLDLINDYAFLLEGYPNYMVHIVNLANIIEPTMVHTRGSRSERMAVTHNRYLVVNNACSSVCLTWLSVSSWSPDSWEFTFIGAHDVYNSWWSLALEINKFYAYAGKDIGLFVYNFHLQSGDGSPLQIGYFDIGDVRGIVTLDDYVYAASVDRDGFVHPPQEGGFFILPAPPLLNTHFPLVARNE